MVILLSTAYFPPIQYMVKFLTADKVLIEDDENYLKQSYRNRCIIAGPNGRQSLIVPVKRGSFHKTHIRDIEVDYTLPWITNHLYSLKTAYRSSPFYEFYIDDMKTILRKKFRYLLELNLALLENILNDLGISRPVHPTGRYYRVKEGERISDYRELIHPKRKKQDPLFYPATYHQVFENKFGFLSNLSIIDLLFNEGTEALSVLRRSIPDDHITNP